MVVKSVGSAGSSRWGWASGLVGGGVFPDDVDLDALLAGPGWAGEAEGGVGEEFGDRVGDEAGQDEWFVGDAGAAAEEGGPGGGFEGVGDAGDERVGALDGDGEHGVGEVVAPGLEGGLFGGAVAAVGGVEELAVSSSGASDGLVVGVVGTGAVDADGERQIVVAGVSGQVGVGVEGLVAWSALGGGEHADEGGAGGVGGGVAVLERGVVAVGLQGAGQAIRHCRWRSCTSCWTSPGHADLTSRRREGEDARWWGR